MVPIYEKDGSKTTLDRYHAHKKRQKQSLCHLLVLTISIYTKELKQSPPVDSLVSSLRVKYILKQRKNQLISVLDMDGVLPLDILYFSMHEGLPYHVWAMKLVVLEGVPNCFFDSQDPSKSLILKSHSRNHTVVCFQYQWYQSMKRMDQKQH